MADEELSRLDALDLAVTQLADAAERIAAASELGGRELDEVMAQIETARRLIGTGG
jgi:hypothetical protein